MIRFSSMPPHEIVGILEVSNPIKRLGNLVDIHGKKCNIHAIIGEYVQVAPVDELHPYLTDTTGEYSGYYQRWLPYNVNVIKDDIE